MTRCNQCGGTVRKIRHAGTRCDGCGWTDVEALNQAPDPWDLVDSQQRRHR